MLRFSTVCICGVPFRCDKCSGRWEVFFFLPLPFVFFPPFPSLFPASLSPSAALLSPSPFPFPLFLPLFFPILSLPFLRLLWQPLGDFFPPSLSGAAPSSGSSLDFPFPSPPPFLLLSLSSPIFYWLCYHLLHPARPPGYSPPSLLFLPLLPSCFCHPVRAVPTVLRTLDAVMKKRNNLIWKNNFRTPLLMVFLQTQKRNNKTKYFKLGYAFISYHTVFQLFRGSGICFSYLIVLWFTISKELQIRDLTRDQNLIRRHLIKCNFNKNTLLQMVCAVLSMKSEI